MEEEKLNNLIYLLKIHHIDSEPLENLIKEYKKIEKQIDLEWVENNYIEKSKYNELIKRNNELEEENRIYKSQLNSAFDNGFISKSKAKEKIEERFGILCMQLGSYERDNATSEQERIAGGINELRKLKKELLQEGDK